MKDNENQNEEDITDNREDEQHVTSPNETNYTKRLKSENIKGLS